MEEPYGFFLRHAELHRTQRRLFRRVSARRRRPRLRRCEPGEMGVVISRYSDVADYDWVAIPLIPYLYSTENASQVPVRVDRNIVNRLRDQYCEAHLMGLGEHVQKGSFWHGGWTELIGVAYERRMYAFRFDTTEEQTTTRLSPG